MKLAEAAHRPTALRVDGQEREPESLKGLRVFAFCAVAAPHSFLMTLGNLGAEVVGIRSFGDHHVYTEDEVAEVFSQARERGAGMVVTTEKDRVKIPAGAPRQLPLGELRIEFELLRGRSTITNMLDFLAGASDGGDRE